MNLKISWYWISRRWTRRPQISSRWRKSSGTIRPPRYPWWLESWQRLSPTRWGICPPPYRHSPLIHRTSPLRFLGFFGGFIFSFWDSPCYFIFRNDLIYCWAMFPQRVPNWSLICSVNHDFHYFLLTICPWRTNPFLYRMEGYPPATRPFKFNPWI